MVAETLVEDPVDDPLIPPPEAPVVMFPAETLPFPLTFGAKLTPLLHDPDCVVVPPVIYFFLLLNI